MKFLRKVLLTTSSLLAGLASSNAAQDVNRIKLQIPINCSLDQDCFIQQLTDIDETEKAIDPFCGSATYDGHKGTDFRLRTLEDIKNNIEVLAAASGKIVGIRKNIADKLIITKQDHKAIKGLECGNGVVINHGNNIVTQYCHMKKDSINLSKGDIVKAGDVLGFVGASGLTQFPHLHIAVRKDGKVIDPFTGNTPSNDCNPKRVNSWWADHSILNAKIDTNLLDANIAGAPIDHDTLVLKAPAPAQTTDGAMVGWVWYINLKQNDQIFIKLQGPNGFDSENLSKPLSRNKASWSGFVGKRQKPTVGQYTLTTYVLRNDEKLSYSEKQIELK